MRYVQLWIVLMLCLFVSACSKKSSGPTGPSPDTTPPSVVSTVPSEGAIVPNNQVLSLTFSEELSSATVTKENFIVVTGTDTIAGTVSYANKIATFIPSSALTFGTYYEVYLKNITDKAGNVMAEARVLFFSTAVPTTPPKLLWSIPAPGAINIAQYTSIVLKFDRPMDVWSSHHPDYYTFDSYQGGHYIKDSAGCLVVSLYGLLEKGKSHTLTISGYVADTWKNELGTPVSIQFTTTQSSPYWATLLHASEYSRAYDVVALHGSYYVLVASSADIFCCEAAHIYRVSPNGNATLFAEFPYPIFDNTALVASVDEYLIFQGSSELGTATERPFLARYDQSGVMTWLKSYAGFPEYRATSTMTCSDNGYAMTLVGNAGTQSFLVKTNGIGDIAWQYNLTAGTGILNAAGCVELNNESILVVGMGSSGKIAVVVDYYGNFVSKKTFGNTSDDVHRVAKTSEDGAVICGNYYRPDGFEDYYIAKLDNTGSLLWERRYQQVLHGSAGYYFTLCQAANGDYLMTSDGASDNQLLRVNGSGGHVSSQTVRFMSGGFKYLEDMIPTADGFVLVGNSAFSSISGPRGFITKLNSQGTL
ncbi:MAG: Ig-like domain-containing protein [Candidatus Kerfeldbacteria bacterium]|nr:Ig-like domain-containing protein [Candidatus Kerfeldbacteria bacterium]